jgi:hypothetical protein
MNHSRLCHCRGSLTGIESVTLRILLSNRRISGTGGVDLQFDGRGGREAHLLFVSANRSRRMQLFGARRAHKHDAVVMLIFAMTAIGGGFNRSLQHIRQTSQLASDRSRSFVVFH